MKATVGRIVQVTFDDATVRAAVVVRTWPPSSESVDDCVNLLVFLDGRNDRNLRFNNVLPTAEEIESCNMWLTSVPCGPGIRKWQWPVQESESLAT